MAEQFSAQMVARVSLVRKARGVRLREFSKVTGEPVVDAARVNVKPGQVFEVTNREEYERHLASGSAEPVQGGAP